MNKIHIPADSLVYHRVNDVLADPQYVDPYYTAVLAKDLVGTTAFVFDGNNYTEFAFSYSDKNCTVYDLEIHCHEYHFRDKERCVGHSGYIVSLTEDSIIFDDWISPISVDILEKGFRLKPYSMFKVHKLSSIDLGTIVIPFIHDITKRNSVTAIEVVQKNSSGKFAFMLGSVFLMSKDIG